MHSLNEKVVVVTGGTRGIGLATAKMLSDYGAKVIVGAPGKTVGNKTEFFDFHVLDVTSKQSCSDFYSYIINTYHCIDGLVNNAGIVRDALIKKMSDEDFDAVINTNLKGTYNMVKLIGPHMVENRQGSIVNLSSVVAEYGNIGQVNYAASKAGLIGATKTWAKEFSMKGENIRVNAICPGYTMTDMLSSVPQHLLDKFSEQTMLKRLAKPEEIASVILFLLSDLASYITGAVIDVNGGMRL